MEQKKIDNSLDDVGWFNKVNNSLFQSKSMATLCYPSMRAVRNILLKLKGVGKLHKQE